MIVVVGRSISGLVLAAGLKALGQRVVLVSAKTEDSEKLVNGCTLRYAALSCIADVFNVPVEHLLEALGGAAFHRFSAMRERDGRVTQTLSSTSEEVGGVSARHGHLLNVLSSLLPRDLEIIEAEVPRGVPFDAATLPLTNGALLLPKNAVILNATPCKDLLRPDFPPETPDGYVCAMQVALRTPSDATIVGRDHATMMVREFIPSHLLFFAPFFDPLQSAANAYIFSGAVFSPEVLQAQGRDAIRNALDDAWRTVAKRHALEAFPTSFAEVFLPFYRRGAVALHARASQLPVFDVNSGFTSGAPGVILDGMTAQAAGAHAFVRAFGNGMTDLRHSALRALHAADKKTATIRNANQINSWLYSHAPSPVRGAVFAVSTNKSAAALNRQSNLTGAATPLEQAKNGLLVRIGEDIWSLRQLQPLGPFVFSSRMTVVRGESGLVVHSPVLLGDEALAALRALGKVAHVVAPNLFHHKALAFFRSRFADAKVWVAPGFAKKFPRRVAGTRELDDAAPVDAALAQVFVRGHNANETIFLHRPSKTLLVTDLAYNIGGEAQGFERFWFHTFGVLKTGRVPKYNRAVVKDEKAFRAVLEKIFAWDFDRVSVAHGRLILSDGKNAIRKQWF